MVTTLEVRRAHFARLARRAVDRAKETRGWGISRVAKEAGIGEATIYRWLEGKWESKPPIADNVLAFCGALGVPAWLAFEILWPGSVRDAGDAHAEALPASRSLLTIQYKLADPATPDNEKFFINETLDGLAARYGGK